jgi:hypothetical protein
MKTQHDVKSFMKKMKKTATKIHKEAQRKKALFYKLLRVPLCNFVAKKTKED